MGIGYAAQQRCMSSSSLDNNKWVKEGTRVNPAEPIYLINFLYNTLWIIFQLKMLCCVVIAWQERLTRIDTHSEYGMEFYCHLSRRVQIKIATKGNKCQEEGGWVYGNALHFPIPIGVACWKRDFRVEGSSNIPRGNAMDMEWKNHPTECNFVPRLWIRSLSL